MQTKARGVFANAEELPPESLMSSGAAKRYEELKVLAKEKEACVVDISQDTHRARVSNVLPTLAKSSQLVSVTQGHFFTPGEIDFAMGWPTVSVENGNKRFYNSLPEAPPSMHPSKSNVFWEVGWATLPSGCLIQK